MQVFGLLVDKVRGIDGARVENNKFCVSVHYRNVNEKVENFKFTKNTMWNGEPRRYVTLTRSQVYRF